MTRKSNTPWTPGPECQAAYERIVETAHICSATLFGEQLVQDPPKEAPPRALIMAMGMMYFLVRIDPKDLRAFASQDGGFGALDWKPFPHDYVVRKKGPFADFAIVPRLLARPLRNSKEGVSA